MRAHVHFHAGELRSLGFKKHALLAGVRLAWKQPSAGADHAVPRNALSGGSSSHGKADSARAAGNSQHFGKLAVGDNSAARDALYSIVDALPDAFLFFAHFAKNLDILPSD